MAQLDYTVHVGDTIVAMANTRPLAEHKLAVLSFLRLLSAEGAEPVRIWIEEPAALAEPAQAERGGA